jgi:hypothetical protein
MHQQYWVYHVASQGQTDIGPLSISHPGAVSAEKAAFQAMADKYRTDGKVGQLVIINSANPEDRLVAQLNPEPKGTEEP